MTVQQARRPNRLINQKSPYLLQHAYNPVDWYPWGTEAFAKAKQEDKPIFLSIGYSTCYWCHVMERESFEDPTVAKMLNDHFVSIKVDREERPDLDAIYMTAVQLLAGQGGWPMTVLLTPAGKPFYGGTYFPPDDRGGRPGLKSVLRGVSDAWRTRRDEMLQSAESVTTAIQAASPPSSPAALDVDVLREAVGQFAAQYDPVHGGFGQAPKFPRSHSLSFLLRMWARWRDPKVLEMVETTLEAMARGGIHDQLGGGFHRYSTDPEWLVPHFEKMLYDQALLARAYLEAYQTTGKAYYAQIAREIFEYVLRDLRDPQGAFYCAEDAGEVGKEGEFYVWTPQQTQAVLGNDAELFNRVYDVTPQGNFEHGGSVLHLPQPIEAAAREVGMPADELASRLASARAKLLAARGQRTRPHRDDKILADWNGLLIGALAYGARVLEEPRYATAASEAAAFLLDRMRRDGQLYHRYRDGQAEISAFLDDYAFCAAGLFELYETTFETRWLTEAARLANEMVRRFWDPHGGGFFFSGDGNERLIAQTKELYDGAVPSGNSVAGLALVQLGQLTMDQPLRQRAAELIQSVAGSVRQMPHAFPQLLIALDAWLGPLREVVIAGDPSTPRTHAMIRALHERFLPRTVWALHPTGDTTIETLVPFLKVQQPVQGQTTAYVCHDYVCNLPTTDLAQLRKQLDATP